MTIVRAIPTTVTAEVLDDLRSRIRRSRIIELVAAGPWSLGIDPTYLHGLLATWADSFDWRAVERRVQAMPWVLAGGEERPIRAVHRPADDPDASAVVLLHGWPDSVLRFEKVLPELTDLHVIVPALPGFPFSTPTPDTAMSAADMAETVAALMNELGYDRYVLSAGDVGTDVAEALCSRHPNHVAALHLTDLSHHHALIDPPTDLSSTEQSYLQRVHQWHAREGGYNHQQSTAPNTLAIGLGDSPAGLAAWVVDKLYRWSDCEGDVESVFTRHDILTWVTAYWVSGVIGTSFAPYANREPVGPITTPTVFTMFPRDIVNAPREFAARYFDIRGWYEAPGGGHFDAWERPVEYVEGIRSAVALRDV